MNRRLIAAVVALALPVTTTFAAAGDDKAACADAAERSQSLREQKKLRDARAALLECSRETCPKVVRKDCVKWLGEVDAGLPSVVFRAKDPDGGDLVDVRVTEGGAALAPKLDGGAITIDPGAHELKFEAIGTSLEPRTERIVVSEGEKNRIVTVTFAKAGGPTAPPAAATTAPPPVTAAPPPKSGSSPWPWIAGGVGVAGLATFGIFQIVARGERSDLEDGCGKTQTCPKSQVDPVRTKFVVSGIGLGVGIVGIGASAVLFATRSSSATVTPTSSGAIASYRLSF